MSVVRTSLGREGRTHLDERLLPASPFLSAPSSSSSALTTRPSLSSLLQASGMARVSGRGTCRRVGRRPRSSERPSPSAPGLVLLRPSPSQRHVRPQGRYHQVSKRDSASRLTGWAWVSVCGSFVASLRDSLQQLPSLVLFPRPGTLPLPFPCPLLDVPLR